jgi:crossover junction endodeoxyribonuclease RusA
MSELDTFFDNLVAASPVLSGTNTVIAGREISFWVAGVPQPGGSKKGFYNPKLGRVMITEDNKRCAPWRAAVSQAAMEATSTMLEGPLRLHFSFVMPRPKGHFGTGKKAGMLKPSAPQFPAQRPDASKLTRSSEDALKGILWRDDSQIVTQVITKRYGAQAGLMVTVTPEKQ